MPSSTLLEAVAVTAELCGRVFSEAAARVFVADLAGYDERQVIGALARCRKEVRGLLTVADVISRLDDGRPGPDEAWAMLPRDEAQSAVWTAEMARAFGIAGPLMDEDRVAARMAFREAYKREVEAARDRREPVTWTATLGHDPGGRAAVVDEAVKLGRLTHSQAAEYVPALGMRKESNVRVLRNDAPKQIEPPADPERVRELLSRARKSVLGAA